MLRPAPCCWPSTPWVAGYDNTTLEQLRTITEADSAAVKSLWAVLAEQEAGARKQFKKREQDDAADLPEQFLILVECQDEQQQVQLLRPSTTKG